MGNPQRSCLIFDAGGARKLLENAAPGTPAVLSTARCSHHLETGWLREVDTGESGGRRREYCGVGGGWRGIAQPVSGACILAIADLVGGAGGRARLVVLARMEGSRRRSPRRDATRFARATG